MLQEFISKGSLILLNHLATNSPRSDINQAKKSTLMSLRSERKAVCTVDPEFTFSLPRTTCREPPLRGPQGRELVEPAGRTTERPVRKRGDECSGVPTRVVPQNHGRKPVVRGFLTDL